MSSSKEGLETSQEVSPNEIFKRMVINDKKQNSRLAMMSSAESLGKGSRDSKPTKTRFFICILGLLALTTSQMSRMVLNQSLPIMVHPDMIKSKNVSSDGSCPDPNKIHVDYASTPLSTISSTSDEVLKMSDDVEHLEETTTASAVEKETTTLQMTTTTTIIPSTTTRLTTDFGDTTVATTTIVPYTTSCPQFETTTTYVPPIVTEEDPVEEPVVRGERFMWDNNDRSSLLGGFYYGYFVFMIPGGRLAEAYGAKYVLLLSVFGSAIINLATPWMARNSFLTLVLSRVLLGAIQGGVFPGMYALFNSWLTMSEASIFAPLIKMNLRLGMMFGSALCGYMEFEWQNTFYTTGAICTIWSILWLFFATSDPEDNRWVSRGELTRIIRKKKHRREPSAKEQGLELSSTNQQANGKPELKEKQEEKKEHTTTPWLRICTSAPVIGLIIVKITFNYAVDFLVILLPSYLSNVHHTTPDMTSYITMPMFAAQVLLVVFVGWLAKWIVARRPYGMTKTTIRKIFQTLANGGMAIFFFALTFNDCNLIYVAVVLQIISFLSMFTAGGETMLPYDLSEKYPATIMAIANSIANMSGVTTTEISRKVLGNQAGDYNRWNILLYLVAGMNLIGTIAFCLLMKAEPIDFDKKKARKLKDVEEAADEWAKPSSPKDQAKQLPVVKEAAVDEKQPGTSAVNVESVIPETADNKEEKTLHEDETRQELSSRKSDSETIKSSANLGVKFSEEDCNEKSRM